MSSLKFKNLLLTAFAVLTMIFGSLFAYEFVQVQELTGSSQIASTTTVTLQPSTTFTVTTSTETRISTSVVVVTATVPNVQDEGELSITFPNKTQSELFAYKRLSDFPEGTSVNFEGVTFYNMPHNMTTCEVYYIKITFYISDGTSERLGVGWCYGFPNTDMDFSNHSNPIAGVILAKGYMEDDKIISSPLAQGIYLLVSGKAFPDI